MEDVGALGGEERDRTPVRFKNNGLMSWSPPLAVTASCTMNIARWGCNLLSLFHWPCAMQRLTVKQTTCVMQGLTVKQARLQALVYDVLYTQSLSQNSCVEAMNNNNNPSSE